MAIGGLVLLGIIGAFAYFLFPNFITGILRGPSYTDIIRAQESEIAAFNRETEVVFSYLTDSWTMKIYRRIESMVGREHLRGLDSTGKGGKEQSRPERCSRH